MGYDVIFPRLNGRKTMQAILVLIGLTGLTLLGRFVSPVKDGKPGLLSPRLAAITAYQRDARRWVDELKDIHMGFSNIFANPTADLLSQDQHANELQGRLLGLAEELDGTRVPPTLETLHDVLEQTISAGMQVSQAITVWLNEPTLENASIVEAALGAAQDALSHLDQNPWIGQP
jgi:hypothetical protein